MFYFDKLLWQDGRHLATPLVSATPHHSWTSSSSPHRCRLVGQGDIAECGGKIQPWRVTGELTAEQLDNIFKVDACVFPDWHENVWSSLKPRFCLKKKQYQCYCQCQCHTNKQCQCKCKTYGQFQCKCQYQCQTMSVSVSFFSIKQTKIVSHFSTNNVTVSVKQTNNVSVSDKQTNKQWQCQCQCQTNK